MTVPFKEGAHSVFDREHNTMKYFIKNISHSSTATILIRIYIQDDNERFQVRELYCLTELLDSIPEVGQYFCNEQYDELESVAKKTEAIKKGFSILSYGANSPHALKVKLIKRGIEPAIATFAANYLTEHGYIRVESDALRMAERCFKKNWGLSRILAYLKSRGFDDQTLFNVEEYYSDVDFSLSCEAMILSNYDSLPTTLKDKSKMINSLTSYGFTVAEIKQAINRILRDSAHES